MKIDKLKKIIPYDEGGAHLNLENNYLLTVEVGQ